MSDSTTIFGSSLASIDLRAQDRGLRPGWGAIVSAALSLALLVVVFRQLDRFDLADLRRLLPVSPLFWGSFAAFYLAGPVSEWLIFRRLWAIPESGILALLRKKIYNEMLLGYLGEAYFYGWARRRVTMVSAPFGAVKDVAILSAMAGNAVTLLLLAAMWPFMDFTGLGLESTMVIGSLAVILLISVAAMFLRRRVFSLPRADLAYIMRMHIARIVATIVLGALLWHLALPAVALHWWLLLSTLRMLVSRLPLVPNKDLVLAGVAVFALGHQGEIGALMALIAALMVVAHLLVGVIVVVAEIAGNPTQEERAP